jgi:hypothetical protein
MLFQIGTFGRDHRPLALRQVAAVKPRRYVRPCRAQTAVSPLAGVPLALAEPAGLYAGTGGRLARRRD